MPFRDLIVSVDASDAGSDRVKLAMRLARRHEAHLFAFFVRPPARAERSFNIQPEGSPAVDLGGTVDPDIVPNPYEISEVMEQRFKEDLELHKISGSWIVISGRVVDEIVSEIRTKDLAILGLGDPDAPSSEPQGFQPDAVISACGRPVLGLPIANIPDEIGKNVLVAWNGSREASRAMNDALPLLATAEAVTLLSVDPSGPAQRSAEAAAAHLRRHGVKVKLDHTSRAGMEIGDAILSMTDYLDADLVVAGAYGHSSLIESVLGGVSRTLLHQMMVPVFVSH